MDLFNSIKSKIRILIFRLRGMRIGKNCYIGNISVMGFKHIVIGDSVYIEDNVRLKATSKAINSSSQDIEFSLQIKNNVFIGYSSVLDSNVNLVIGNNCMIGPMCFFTDSDHIHHLTDIPIVELGGVYLPTFIDDNCWFGAHCIVVKGVKIGKNSIFGANTTIVKNTNESSIYVGTPAKKIE